MEIKAEEKKKKNHQNPKRVNKNGATAVVEEPTIAKQKKVVVNKKIKPSKVKQPKKVVAKAEKSKKVEKPLKDKVKVQTLKENTTEKPKKDKKAKVAKEPTKKQESLKNRFLQNKYVSNFVKLSFWTKFNIISTTLLGIFFVCFGLVDLIKTHNVAILLKCLICTIVICVPYFVLSVAKQKMPAFCNVLLNIFVFTFVYVGNICNGFETNSYFGIACNFCIGLLAVLFAMVAICSFGKEENNKNTFAICFFSLCSAVAIGAIIEVVEFVIDAIFGSNLQNFAIKNGSLFVGQEAVMDTMIDLITICFAALLCCVVVAILCATIKNFANKFMCKTVVEKSQEHSNDMQIALEDFVENAKVEENKEQVVNENNVEQVDKIKE